MVPFVQKFYKQLILVVAAAFMATMAMMTATSNAAVIAGCDFDQNGNIWTLQGNCTSTTEIVVPAGTTIEGGGFTISPDFVFVSNPSANSVVEIVGDNVAINDLKIEGVGGTNIHGVNIYNSDGVVLTNVTSENNDKTGIVVNSSEVTVNNVTTSGNGWHGINVDEVVAPATLNITGPMNQTDFWHVYVDDTREEVEVNDVHNQYSYTDNPVDGAPVNDYDGLYTLTPEKVEGLTIRKGHTESSPVIGCGGYTNSTQIRIEWDASDANNIDYYWFGIKNKPKHAQVTNGDTHYNGNMTPGNDPYYYTVIAVDVFGNESPISDQCSVVLDQEAPDVEITAPSDGDTLDGVVDVDGTVTDDNLWRYYTVVLNSSNQNVAGPGTVNWSSSFSDTTLFSFDTTTVPNGTYTIRLEARDLANNKDAGSVDVITVTVDNPVVLGAKDECKEGGWATSDIPVFRNQGDCVSHFASANQEANNPDGGRNENGARRR